MQVLVWVVSTVLLKFMLSTVLCASDDVRVAAPESSVYSHTKNAAVRIC